MSAGLLKTSENGVALHEGGYLLQYIRLFDLPRQYGGGLGRRGRATESPKLADANHFCDPFFHVNTMPPRHQK